MKKTIRSQCNQKLQLVPHDTPFYFSIAPEVVDGEKEGEKVTIFSVGIGNVSFGIFRKKKTAESVLDEIEKFLLEDDSRYQVPADS